MAKILRPTPHRDDTERPALPVPPPNASVGKRWKFRRNLVIYLAASRNGLSQRFLADVFDLPRSRIAVIIKEFAEIDPSRKPAHQGSVTD